MRMRMILILRRPEGADPFASQKHLYAPADAAAPPSLNMKASFRSGNQ